MASELIKIGLNFKTVIEGVEPAVNLLMINKNIDLIKSFWKIGVPYSVINFENESTLFVLLKYYLFEKASLLILKDIKVECTNKQAYKLLLETAIKKPLDYFKNILKFGFDDIENYKDPVDNSNIALKVI